MLVDGAGGLELFRKDYYMILPLIGTITFTKVCLMVIFSCFMGIVFAEAYRFIKEKI